MDWIKATIRTPDKRQLNRKIKPAMKEFICPYRLHRLAYFWRLLVANTVLYYLYSCSTTTYAVIWWALIVIVTIYGLLFIVLPRIRDIGLGRGWILALFIPFVGFIFGIVLLLRAPVFLPNHPGTEPQPT